MREVAIERALTWVEPGPVTLVTTCDGKRNNIMTITWTMAKDFDQHIILATGPWNRSYGTLRATGECVVCIPPASLAETAVGIGMVSGADTDKIRKFGLTALPAKTVRAPLIAECLACLECVLEEEVEEYGLLVLKVRRVVENESPQDRRMLHAVGDGTFFADGERIVLREQMRGKLPPGL